MSRPRKSTFDAWLDQFALWSHDDREGAMKALESQMAHKEGGTS